MKLANNMNNNPNGVGRKGIDLIHLIPLFSILIWNWKELTAFKFKKYYKIALQSI